ncbi:hypothetical protein DYH09_13080 [bacterium CPR1]|nr:hypothetical protein [bacterium CPR1]
MADGINSLGVSKTQLMHGVHAQNLKSVAANLADNAAGVTDALDKGDKSAMAEDLGALKRAVWARVPDSGSPDARNLAQMSNHTLFMTAGAMLGPVVGAAVTDALQHKLHELVSSPENLDQFASKLVDFHKADQGITAARYDSLTTQVTSAVTYGDSKVGSANVPTALFMAGVLLEADQRKGLLPGQEGT